MQSPSPRCKLEPPDLDKSPEDTILRCNIIKSDFMHSEYYQRDEIDASNVLHNERQKQVISVMENQCDIY